MIPWKRKIRILDPLEGYGLWAATYRDEKNPIKVNSDRLIEKWFPDVKGKSVLDAGCGPGKFCKTAEDRGAAYVQGMDIAPGMITLAREDCTRTEFVIGDFATSPPPPNRFDLVLCALALGHCRNFQTALQNLCHSVALNGTLIVTDFHPALSQNNDRRTFRDKISGETFAIRHFGHPLSEYGTLLSRWGFVLELCEEPTWQNTPVIFGLKARRIH